MKRTSFFAVCVWLVILTIVLTSHLQIRHWMWPTVCGLGAAVCTMFFIFLRRQRTVRIYGMLAIAVLLAAVYGLIFAAMCLSHPKHEIGVPIRVEATVTKISVKQNASTVQLQVIRQGQPSTRCSYVAFWRAPVTEAMQLQVADTVFLNGMFVQFASSSKPIQQWLSPAWSFRGHLVAVAVPANKSTLALHLQRAVVQTVPASRQPLADLALSMVIGRAAPVSANLQTLFLQAGVTHLLAASGANVLLFCRFAAVLWGMTVRAAGVRSWWLEHLFLLAAIWFFATVCGDTTPIVRAALLTSYGLLAQLFRRRVKHFMAISFSSLLFAVWQPYQLTSVSGLFSLAATLALNEVSGVWRRQPQPGKRFTTASESGWMWYLKARASALLQHLLELFFVSLMMDAYMLPLVWWWFQQLTPYGALATVLVDPLLLILLPLTVTWGLLALVAGVIPIAVLLWDAEWVGAVTVQLVSVCVHLLRVVAGWSHSLVQLPPLPVWLLLIYFCILVAWQHIIPHGRHQTAVFHRETV